MKIVLGIGAVVLVAIIGFVMWSPSGVSDNAPMAIAEGEAHDIATMMQGERSVVSEGTYVVQADESKVNWAGQKPLLDGYVNSGSIAVAEGAIEVEGEVATGVFTIDMNTLSVSQTPTKPGKESALEGHLKGEGWFNVAAFPEASFAITEVAPRADSDTTFQYDITGELTMKGVTDTLAFPATIYTDAEGVLHADASFEFDRTKWGVTSGSGSFFDSLADNVIDDMVALSFNLVAIKQ